MKTMTVVSPIKNIRRLSLVRQDAGCICVTLNAPRLSGRRPPPLGRSELVARRSAPTAGLDGSKRPTGAKETTPLDASVDTDRFDSRLEGRHAQWCPIEPPSGLQIECG